MRSKADGWIQFAAETRGRREKKNEHKMNLIFLYFWLQLLLACQGYIPTPPRIRYGGFKPILQPVRYRFRKPIVKDTRYFNPNIDLSKLSKDLISNTCISFKELLR